MMPKLQNDIQAIGEAIWRHPETGYREVETSNFLAKKFEDLGFKVRRGLALTGFRADLDTGRPGPTIGVVGELDALIQPCHPEAVNGVAHSCGHHTHAAAIWGAAAALKNPEVLSQLCGRIAFIAAPAEEGIELEYRKQLYEEGKIRSFSGKSQLIREGVFDDVDISFMNHVGAGLGTNNCNGNVKKVVTFLGQTVYACNPHRGCNPLNAMDMARHAIALLRDSVSIADPTSRIHGIITSAGGAVNTIPNTAVMSYMVRASTVESVQKISQRFDHAVYHAALAMEAGIKIETFHGSLPLYNSDALVDVMREVSGELVPDRVLGYKNSHDHGSTDMGDVSQIMPAVHLNVLGSNGCGHLDNFAIKDPVAAYSGNAELLAQFTYALLKDGASRAKAVLEAEKPQLTKEKYIAAIDSLTTVKSISRNEVLQQML